MPGGVWRIAFSIRFSASRCSSSRAPVDDRRAAASTSSSWPLGHRPELGGRLDARPGARSVGRGGASRLGVGAREQQQVGDQPAHALRRAQRERGGLAALAVEHLGQQLEVGQHARQRRAQLVRGVGDELALAGERRLGLLARGRRARGASRRASAPARRPRRRRAGCGHARGRGRASAAISRAVAVSAGDRAHRAAREPQAAEQRQRACRRARRGAGSSRTRVDGVARGRRPGGAYWIDDRDRARSAPSGSSTWRGLDAVAADARVRRGAIGSPKFGAPRRRADGSLPSLASRTRITALLGAGVGVAGRGATS